MNTGRKRFQFALLCLCAALILAAGCRKSAPMHSPEQRIDNPNLTLSAMTDIIKEAAVQRHWIVKVEKPGYIVATQETRGHMARVGISYTANTFAIRYLDSSNLNAQDGNIHDQYNVWVRNLERDIRVRASSR